MNNLKLDILGFQAVNRDLQVELRDTLSNTVVRQAKPFLDGSLTVPRVNPGAYELVIRHPNLTLPVARRPLRVLPTGTTKVSVIIDPAQFRDTPIADIPDADLSPVRQLAESVAETMATLADKRPGEAIKAEDWNALAAGLADTARALVELTRLVSPQGHNHAELETKFDEVTGNFRGALEILNAAMAELQRQIQSLRFRRTVEDVLDRAGVDPTTDRGRGILDLVGRLEQDTTKPPREFSRTARGVGVELGTRLDQLIEEQADNPAFRDDEAVVKLGESVEVLRNFDSRSYDSEIAIHRKTDRTLGGGALKALNPPRRG
ncbi:MAG: hypothetical protein PVH47_03985 [Thiohalocapsa sp.]|jgi:hypothetical protein